MDEAADVSREDDVANASEEFERRAGVEAGRLYVLVNGLAGDVVHHEIAATADDAGVVDVHDAGVLQAGEDADFAVKAGAVDRAGERAGEHELYCHESVGGELDGLVHDALTAAMSFADDAVSRNVGQSSQPTAGQRRQPTLRGR